MAQAVPFIFLAISAASAAAQIKQGLDAKKSAGFQADFLKDQARQRQQIAAAEAARTRKAGQRLLGSQRAAFGASGVVTTLGTPLDVLADTAGEIELEALRALFEGRNDSDLLRFQASQVKEEGRQALTSGIIGAGTTLLGGASGFSELGGLGSNSVPTGTSNAIGTSVGRVSPAKSSTIRSFKVSGSR